jgi:hypothetical protein
VFAISSSIFLVINCIQIVVDPLPVSFVEGGRFLGTTGNPQHAATLIALCLPALFYLLLVARGISRVFFGVLTFALLYLLLWTQSRTGMIMAGLAFLVFYWQYIKVNIIRSLVVGAILFFGLFYLIERNVFASSSSILLSERLKTAGNTRELVWTGMLNAFNDNVLWGIPFENRYVPGENSWLSVAAGFGLAGLVPMILYGMGCINLVLRLITLVKNSDIPEIKLAGRSVIVGIIIIFVGSFGEGFLLGTLAFPLFGMLLYVVVGGVMVNSLSK